VKYNLQIIANHSQNKNFQIKQVNSFNQFEFTSLQVINQVKVYNAYLKKL